MKRILLISLAAMLLFPSRIFSQAAAPGTVVYPKTVGYLSFVLPLVVINKDQTTNDFSNFKNSFAIGFPVGLNVLYSSKFGFSYEITPTIQAVNGSTKTSKIAFSPGPMFRFQHGVTITTRLAFETTGRYGVTPVVSKVVARSKAVNYFIAASLPARFGNAALPSIGGNLQFGIVFN